MDYRKRPPPGHRKREQKERILALLESNRRLKSFHKSGKSKYTHIFSGLLICGNCGQPMTSSISTVKKTTGRRYSLYFCPTHRKSKLWCTGKSTSDPIIGEFVFNYILNMLNAQKAFSPETSIQKLEQQLLSGDTFSQWLPLPRTDYRICFIRSAPALSKAKFSEKTSKSKQTLSRRCSYRSSKRKKSVWRELLTV